MATKAWPPREDRRQRRERQVTNANRVGTYGLTDEVQSKLRDMAVQALLDEAPHPDSEVRLRHIGAKMSELLVLKCIIEGKPEPWMVAVIDGVLATELRRYATRIEREEFDQSTAVAARQPQQETLFS